MHVFVGRYDTVDRHTESGLELKIKIIVELRRVEQPVGSFAACHLSSPESEQHLKGDSRDFPDLLAPFLGPILSGPLSELSYQLQAVPVLGGGGAVSANRLL